MNSLSNKGVVKFFSTLTSVATVLSLSGVAYLAPVATLAVAPADYGLTEGNTISAPGSDDPDVYIINELGYKRLFLNPVIFSFYGHLGGFPAVKSVSASTRDAFGTSGLFRNCETNDPKVYGLGTTGEDVGMLHWVNTTGAQAVIDDANFFKKVFCINNNEFNWYPKGADYMSVNDVPVYSRGGGTPPPVVTGPVSVSLASSNPISGTIVDGQARYDLAEFMFSGNATVTSVKLMRIGVSADASITNVYLYDGAKRLTDSATVSSSEILFNDASGLFTVAGSKVISVIADIDGTSGETIGVQLISVNGTAVSLSGNLHSIATATLAGITFAVVTTPADTTADGLDDANSTQVDPADDVVAWQDTVSITQRYVWLKSIQLRVIGSAALTDLQNFRLYVDGVQIGNTIAQRDASNYLLFDLTANPVKLETGNRVFKVLVNIVGGSSKDFFISLRQKPDFWAVDSQYGAAVLSSSTFPIGDVDNELEIQSGTLTVTKKNDSPSGDVVKGASGVTLATYEFKAAGEKMKVENLRIAQESSNNELALRNAAIFADGVQVGSTTTLWEVDSPTASSTAGYAEVSLGSSLIVVPGTPRTVEIRADIYDASGTDNVAANDTITAEISIGSSNVQRMVTLDYVNGPSADKAANALTIKTGSFTAGKYTGYADQSVVSPKSAVKIGHYTLAAASSEDVNVNTLTFDGQSAYGGNGTLTSDFTDAYVKVYSDAGSLVYTSPIKTTFSHTASNSYSVSFNMPKNKTYKIELWANVASTFAATDKLQTNLDAAGTTVGSSTAVTATAVTGQTISGASGSLTVANGSLPTARFVNGGTTLNTYNFTLTPAYDDFTVDEVYVDIPSATTASNSGAVASVILKQGSTTLQTAVVSATTGSASFTGLNLAMPQSGGTKTFAVDVVFTSVGTEGNDTAGSVTMRLDGLKYRNSAGTITTTTGLATATYAGNAFTDVKGYPTFTATALPTTVLSGGTQTLFKTTLSATGGQIAWNSIKFTVASSSAVVTIASATYKLWENGVDITDSATGATASDSYSGSDDYIEFSFATERVVAQGSPTTLELRATVTGALVAGNSITTQIANPTGTTVTSEDSTTQGAKTASFVWSDQSSPAHSTSTDDWFTDGLVKTLADTQIIVK